VSPLPGNRAVDDGLTIEIRGSEDHLWLVVDERNDAIVGRQRTFLTTLYMTVVLRQDYPSFLEVELEHSRRPILVRTPRYERRLSRNRESPQLAQLSNCSAGCC